MSGADAEALAVALVCAGLIGVAVWLIARPRVTLVDRVKGYVDTGTAPTDQTKSLIERALGDEQATQLARLPLVARVTEQLDVASVPIAPVPLALGTAALTVLIGWAVATATDSLFAAFLGLFVPVVVLFVLATMAERQRRTFSEQLPDNLQVVAASLRSGQTFAGSLRAAALDAPEPSHRELWRAVTDEAIGIPMQTALEQVATRMHSDEIRNLALIAMLQRETGGSSAEVIDLIAETAREKIELRRLVRGLTAQGRLSGSILTMMPIAILLFVSLVNPNYVHPLFHTKTGVIAVVLAVMLLVVGSMFMRKIVDVKV